MPNSTLLKSFLQNQDQIIQQCFQIPDKIEHEILVLTKKSHELDIELEKNQNILLSLLSKKDTNDPPKNSSIILKEIFSDIQSQLFQLCEHATDDSSTSLPITAVYDMENQIKTIINDLIDQNLYPETFEEKKDRELTQEDHDNYIMSFLSSYLRNNRESDSDESNSNSSDISEDESNSDPFAHIVFT